MADEEPKRPSLGSMLNLKPTTCCKLQFKKSDNQIFQQIPNMRLTLNSDRGQVDSSRQIAPVNIRQRCILKISFIGNDILPEMIRLKNHNARGVGLGHRFQEHLDSNSMFLLSRIQGGIKVTLHAAVATICCEMN